MLTPPKIALAVSLYFVSQAHSLAQIPTRPTGSTLSVLRVQGNRKNRFLRLSQYTDPLDEEDSLFRKQNRTLTGTLFGLSGILRVPTADFLVEGDMRTQWTPSPLTESRLMGGKTTYAVTLSPINRLEFGVGLGDERQRRDLTLNAKYLLTPETRGFPAFALGISDLKRTGRYKSNTLFLVGTKHLFDNALVVTFGATKGENDGIVGGVQVPIGSSFQLMGEVIHGKTSYGAQFNTAGGWSLRAAKIDMGMVYTLGYSFPITGAKESPPAPVQIVAKQDTMEDAAHIVQQTLVRKGMEDVSVEVLKLEESHRLVATFENRMYTLNEIDALAMALRVLAKETPDSIEEIGVQIKRRGIVVVLVTVNAAGFRYYLNGSLNRKDLQELVTVTLLPPLKKGEVLTTTPIANPSTGHSDLILNPGVTSEIGSNRTTLDVGLFFRPELSMPLGKGLLLNARWEYPLVGHLTRDLPKRWDLQRAYLAYAFHPVGKTLAQVSMGYFPFSRAGGMAEVMTPVGKTGYLRGSIGYFVNNALLKTHWTGEYWHTLSRMDVQIRLFAGRFVEGDTGWGVDLLRNFNEIQLGVGLRRTNISNLIEARIVVPLGGRLQRQHPGAFRVRPPDFLEHRVRSALASANYLSLATKTAVEMVTGSELTTTYFNRNRNQPDYIKEHLY